MDAPWRIELFGWLRAVQPDRTVSRFQTRKTACLLAYLAFFRDRSHPRQALIELLWPESPVAAGQNRLKVALSSLRRQLEPPGVPPGAVILANRVSIQLNPAACDTDVAGFEANLQAAARASSQTERSQSLITAVDLYRGELLPGYFEEWVLEEQQRLSEAYVQALRQLMGLLKQANDHSRAIEYARRAVATDPLREEEQHDLIRLLAAAGQPVAAVRQYRELERLLAEELGVTPQDDIRRFVQTVERSEVRTRHSDHGPTFRLPRAAAPERLYPIDGSETASRDCPPPNAPRGRRGSLPMRFTRFFGREAEVAGLQELLLSDQPALVTLTGPGGSGKTRLALEVAAQLHSPFHGAVWFAPLADLTDSRFIASKLAEALRLPRSPEAEPLEQVVAALAQQRTLLILDNFEHLVTDGTTIVRMLWERVPALTLLVTSQRRLDLAGEREFPVAPLPVPEGVGCRAWGVGSAKSAVVESDTPHPTPYTLMLCASVRLFVDRAQAVRPDFQITPANAAAVAGLCAQLEGLPLALELAAARAGVLTPTQILTRLSERFELLVSRQRDADPRHRSLRAALDWSYQLLSPPVQQCFARLSVFRGGWTLAAAETVCEEPRALDYLECLRESSLVVVESPVSSAQWAGDSPTKALSSLPTAGEMRYRLTETVREYAAEQLAPEERAAMHGRHAEYCLALAETAEPELHTAAQGEWLERLEREHDNLRLALGWAKEHGEAESGLRLAGALQRFWRARGHPTEGREWLAALLALPAATERTAARAKALNAAGKLTYEQGDRGAARALYEESLAIGRELGSKPSIGSSLNDLGDIAHYEGDPVTAQALYEESLAIHRELGDRPAIAFSLSNLGDLALAQGDLEAALSLLEESLTIWRELGLKSSIAGSLHAIARVAATRGDYETARLLSEESVALGRELGNKPGIATSLNFLGDVTLWRGMHHEARALYHESLSISRDAGSQADIGWALSNLGDVAYQLENMDEARSLYHESLAIARELNNRWGVGGLLTNLGRVALREGNPQAGRALVEESLAIRRDLGDKRGIAECLAGQAGVDAVEGQFERAARLFGAAEALRERIGARLWPVDLPEHERRIAAVREGLTAAVFATAWAAGRALPPEQAVAEGLGEPERPGAMPVRQITPGASMRVEDQPRTAQGDLTAEEWNRIAPFLPASAGRRGRPYQEHRRVVDGILWVLRTRAHWRDLPARYGSWHTCHDRYLRWRRAGLWERIDAALAVPADPPG